MNEMEIRKSFKIMKKIENEESEKFWELQNIDGQQTIGF